MSVRVVQVALTKQGIPAKTLQAVRMLLAPQDLYDQHGVADFAQQVDAMHEESCLQVLLCRSQDAKQCGKSSSFPCEWMLLRHILYVCFVFEFPCSC